MEKLQKLLNEMAKKKISSLIFDVVVKDIIKGGGVTVNLDLKERYDQLEIYGENYNVKNKDLMNKIKKVIQKFETPITDLKSELQHIGLPL